MSKVTVCTIGDLIEFQRGYDLPKSQFVKGAYPVVSSNGILGYHDEYKVKGAGITIGRSGTVGLPHLIKSDFYPHNTSLFIKDFKGNDIVYIYYLLKNLKLGDKKSGSGVPTMNRNHLHPIKIVAHLDLHDQKSIAKILSHLDAKIELNNKINQELEAMAKMLYEYWFVQFDFPNEQGQPYKTSGGKMVYSKELKREIPEGWEVKKLSDWIKKYKNGDWGKETEEGNYTLKVSCVRGADINGLNGMGELNAPTRYILKSNDNKTLLNHDLIIEISGGSPTQSTGRLAFITEETLKRFYSPLICSNFCKALTLKNEKYLYNFVYLWNRLYDNGVLFGWEGKTSGIKNLLFESFVTHQKEVFPKLEVIEKFYEFAKPIHTKKQMNLLENQRLAELRDWLLPMLMNGQVSVGEAEERFNIAAEPQINYNKN
ncbi:MAG: restriction endonuclease subunit S [Bacteroidales bacterium]|nr:restriction endonuclease subunit S [Bacteroidales bacterium]